MSDARSTVLLTRPAGSAPDFVRILEERGIGVLHVPMIEIVPPDDPRPVDEAIDALGTFDGVVFTSAHAVGAFLERMRERGVPPTALPPAHAVGAKTAAALRAHGVDAATVPDGSGAASLANALDRVTGRTYLHPASDIAREEFFAAVEARGGTVRRVTAYRTISPDPDDVARAQRSIEEGAIDCIAFFSPSAARNFASLVPLFKQATVLVAAIGQTTAAAAMGSGFRVDVVAPEQSAASLAQAIADRLASGTRVDIDPTMHVDDI